MESTPVAVPAVLAFLITALTGFWLIPVLRRLKYGQTILEIGPKWHLKKQGIPTMGGIMFIAGIAVSVLVVFWLPAGGGGLGLTVTVPEGMGIILGLIMALAYGMVGFVDDYIKVVKKRNMGLNARQKMMMQFFIAILYLTGLYLAGERSTIVFVPFMGQWDMGLIYYPLATLGIVYLVNVVNLTDGIDGLCSSVTFVAALGFLGIATFMRMEGMVILAAALAGGTLGFLMWNFYPARVFMGDTGSLFLGGMVVALAFGLGIPVFLIFMGIVYILEGLSVLIQVTWFKITKKRYGEGRRVFKMSPIHHHYEMKGWSETKIVAVFSLIETLGCLAAFFAARMI
ncbi:MAG: phospho-N-acetylmuramoyl-pentapeptide-transferase [Oscillospiraceae bacterium]|jgi:phospho-N-acetylmuramoyl-pentapeptide-transferase|nr:phospho-N-acetylmuramoyl-pentapeptide-transferase [Oscillospiraceae bacterium]